MFTGFATAFPPVTPRSVAPRRRRPLALALLAAAAVGCTDKALVTDVSAGRAQLGVAVGMAGLAADGDISAVRLLARYDNPALGRSVALGEVTVPYQQGDTRSVTLTLEIAECLQVARQRDAAATACPVLVAVEVLSGTRVLVRDELPVVNVRGGEIATAPALSARGAAAVRVRVNGAAPPSPFVLATGDTVRLSADALDAAGAPIAGRAISWTSNAPAVATVSATGLVTVLATGTAEISAAIGTGNAIVRQSVVITATPPVPAAVALAPAVAAIGVGGTLTLTPAVTDSRGVAITPVPALTWQSSQATVATVTPTGVVTAVSPGTTTITARTANNVTGTATITVAAVPASMTLSPTAAALTVGGTQSFSAVVRDAAGGVIAPAPTLTWSSSATAVATASAAGLVTAVGPGLAVITARTANGVSATANVTVAGVVSTLTLAPAQFTVGVGLTQALTATARDGAGVVVTPAPALTWQSGNPAIATVSTAGVVTGVATGATVITARTAAGVVGSASVTVAVATSLSGRVIDAETNAAIAGATVSATVNGDTRSAATDAQGVYSLGSLFGSTIDLRITAAGYIAADVRGLTLSGDRTVEATPLVKTGSGTGTITGDVRNATTNLVIPDSATVELYAGQNVVTGTPIATTRSNANGAYTFTNIPAGTYTLLGRANGFSTGSRTTTSLGGGRTTAQQRLILSPTTASGALRVVLTWGDRPADLDSHLTGPTPTGGSFWVYWASTGTCNTAPFACLDVDEVNGRGPETITIARVNSGRYVYSVHNYSGEAPMSQSGARVDVYGQGGLLRTFNMPAAAGTLWTVFSWDGTSITPINTVSNNPPPANAAAGEPSPANRQPMPVKPPRPRR